MNSFRYAGNLSASGIGLVKNVAEGGLARSSQEVEWPV